MRRCLNMPLFPRPSFMSSSSPKEMIGFSLARSRASWSQHTRERRGYDSHRSATTPPGQIDFTVARFEPEYGCPVQTFVRATVEKFGTVHCAFNNSGIPPPTRSLAETQ